MTEWISVKDRDAPPMQTIILCVAGKSMVGWNESIDCKEDASYCSWESWPETHLIGEGVTHWMPLPEPPFQIIGDWRRCTAEDAFKKLNSQISVKKLMKNLSNK